MAVVYALTCSATGMSYVGCTKGKLGKRLREHRCLLNGQSHTSKILQRDWLLYGEDTFTINIVQDLGANVTLETKRKAELSWMNALDADGLLYNENKASFSPTPEAIAKGIEASRHIIGNRWSPEANKMRSEAQKGIPKGHGAKISATKRANRLAALTK